MPRANGSQSYISQSPTPPTIWTNHCCIPFSSATLRQAWPTFPHAAPDSSSQSWPGRSYSPRASPSSRRTWTLRRVFSTLASTSQRFLLWARRALKQYKTPHAIPQSVNVQCRNKTPQASDCLLIWIVSALPWKPFMGQTVSSGKPNKRASTMPSPPRTGPPFSLTSSLPASSFPPPSRMCPSWFSWLA